MSDNLLLIGAVVLLAGESVWAYYCRPESRSSWWWMMLSLILAGTFLVALYVLVSAA